MSRLKLLSFNIQVGIDTNNYADYISKSWRHILPHPRRHINLSRIAEVISEYDIVALQEVDAGSLRSDYVNQVEHLAKLAGFPYWHLQRNRNLAKIAAHANGLLSNISAEVVTDHSLPGIIPGRGALQASFGCGEQPLIIMVVHLALSHRARCRQLKYIAEALSGFQHFILMGDMNCEPEDVVSQLIQYGVPAKRLTNQQLLPTYPSWKPSKQLDQIVTSDHLQVERVHVVSEMISDHLPIAMEICLPDALAQNIKQRHESSKPKIQAIR